MGLPVVVMGVDAADRIADEISDGEIAQRVGERRCAERRVERGE